MDFKNKVILAPMAAVNNIAFRKLCTDHGADIVYSQMIDSISFAKGSRKLADIFDEKNLVAQFFGNDPKIIAKCAKAVEDKVQAIDLNLGCPHPDIIKRKCGSYLMNHPKKVALIARELVKSVDIPITVKIRAGYGKNNAVRIARICEKEGVSAVAVHGRLKTVKYELPVDYKAIKEVKENVNIPVIGNGDIFCGKDAKKMLDETGCDSVMVARGAIGNPAIFNEIKCYLKGKKVEIKSSRKMFMEYLGYCKKYKIEFKDIKRHAQWLTKGVKDGAKCRLLMNRAADVDNLKEIYKSIG